MGARFLALDLEWFQRRIADEALLQESLALAICTDAMKPSDLGRVIVDTTVRPKNITFPTDAKLTNLATNFSMLPA